MPFPYLDETIPLNEETRKGLLRSFITLPSGVTHYEEGGDPNGLPVVLVHGFSVPYFIFDPTFDFLCKQGFRVLRYDLIGRGFSDRPNVRYDAVLFVRQLKELLDALKFKDINLVGLSMGGAVTASFIDAYPEYVTKYILIDPCGARPISLSPLLKAVRMPMLGELILGLFGTGNMVKGIASDLFTPELVAEFQAKYKIQMHYQGFKRAILSTMRCGMLDSFIETYKRVGKMNKPTLLFWGKQDATVPFEHSGDIRAAIPHAEFHAFDNCGHIPHYERPSEVNGILLEFLKR
ncbi:MAG: alpha/beta hydrolase [Chloroflexi bacterium]|nr:alpha/beta hydrolase [Chloroflexota bacterium]MBI3169736.1 alpha/beta hydrolase [Chloroflexota bacterium]